MKSPRFTVGSVTGFPMRSLRRKESTTWYVQDSWREYRVVFAPPTRFGVRDRAELRAAELNAEHEAWLAEHPQPDTEAWLAYRDGTHELECDLDEECVCPR